MTVPGQIWAKVLGLVITFARVQCCTVHGDIRHTVACCLLHNVADTEHEALPVVMQALLGGP